MHIGNVGRRSILSLALAAAIPAPAAAITIQASWTGLGNGATWSDPVNWDVHVVPLNSGTVNFDVIVPATGAAINFNVAGTGTIQTLTLGDNSRLRPLAGDSLVVAHAAAISGLIDASGGNFTASEATTQFAGQRARVYAALGSQVVIGASSYSSKGLVFSDTSGLSNVYTSNLFTATDAGTVLDLSSLKNIDAGFGPQANDVNRHEVAASAAATLNLSGVQIVNAPSSYSDWIRFSASGAGTSLRLDSLATLSSAGQGRTAFDVSAGAVLSLPSLATLSNVVFNVSGGGRVVAAGGPATYSSRALVTSDSSGLSNVYTTSLFTTTGGGSFLDLSALKSIDAGFDAQANDVNRHEIAASGGATLDLSGLQSVKAPTSYSDWLRFSASGTGTSLRLDSLATIVKLGNGRTVFEATSGAVLNLPQLATPGNVVFNAASGASIVANGNALAYSSKALVTSDSSGLSNVYTTRLFTAADAGTVLDLAAVKSIDAGFAAQANDVNRHEISASAGATLKLSGLQSVTAPSSYGDWIRFSASGAATSLRLDSLATLTSARNGRTSFDVSDGAILNLPQLASLANVVFNAASGASIVAAGNPFSYSSKAMVTSDSSGLSNVYTTNLFTASGAGSVLNLSALKSIDAGFGAQANDVNRHEIAVTSGARLNLSGMTSLVTPVSSSDWLRLTATGAGSSIDLSHLASATSAGTGQLLLSAADGARIDLGGAAFATPATTLAISGGSTVHVLGSLATANTGAMSVTLGHAGDRLEVAGSFSLAKAIRISAAAGATVTVGGNLSYAQTDEALMALGHAVLQFNGSGVQQLEVGGLDVDVVTALLSNDNFGFGQLLVGQAGQPGQPTVVELTDFVNNGNRGAGNTPEALYLYGLGAGTEGLHILGGSTLVLDGLPAYALHNGSLISLYSLFPSGTQVIPFDQGFLALSVPEPGRFALLLAGTGLLLWRRWRAPRPAMPGGR
jgi:hypothetical protein